jgi:predicted esterase
VPPQERHVRVHRTARFYVLGTPRKGKTRELWVACHGYGQLAGSFARALEPLNDGSRIVIAPEALSRFYLDEATKRHGSESPVGATWMTREDRETEIADYVEYLDIVTATVGREIKAKTRGMRVVVLGFSQGVATAARWAALGKTKIHRLILWAGTLPTDLPSDRGEGLFKRASLVMVAGLKDKIIPASAIEHDYRALARRGVRTKLVQYNGAHALHSETLKRLAADAQ